MKLLKIHILIFLISNSIIGQEKVFSPNEIIEDFNYLKKELLENHPNLFVYSSKNEFDLFINELKNSVKDSLTDFEAYSIISKTSSIIKDGHTLFFPPSENIEYYNLEKKFFPFQLYWDGNNLFVAKNFSSNKNIKDGDEIISINDVPSKELVHNMLSNLMRDGNNLNYPVWVLNNYFSEYYSYFYGHPNDFKIQLTNSKENKQSILIKGLHKAEISKIKNSKYSKSIDNKGIDLKFHNESNTAILKIKSWDNSILKNYYNQKFQKAIDIAFDKIFANKAENLIIDIRDNQGGDIKNGKTLLSYILNAPFEMVDGYKKLNGQQELVSCKGPQMGFHKPNKKRFNGKIFFITNGGSFSNSGIVSSTVQKYKRGKLVGVETGGSGYVLSGSIKNIELPNSKISVQIPTLQFIIKQYQNIELSGVKPDFEFKPAIESLTQEKDETIEFTLGLLNE